MNIMPDETLQPERRRSEHVTRPLYWSIRREIWENRSIYIAPLVIMAIVLFSALVSATSRLPRKMRGLALLDPAKQISIVTGPYSMAAALICLTGILVALFYCIDALYGERRDRSILFWKSMPVSDRTTILSKASIPLLVLPSISFILSLASQIAILILSTVVLAAHGIPPSALWSRLPLASMTFILGYGILVHALWFAPIYGWLLLVSAWARRATYLWAILPIFAIGILEKLTMGTTHMTRLLRYRVLGAMQEAFVPHAGNPPITRIDELTPMNFLSSPGLWLGLLFAALCLTAAVRLRRKRQPI